MPEAYNYDHLRAGQEPQRSHVGIGFYLVTTDTYGLGDMPWQNLDPRAVSNLVKRQTAVGITDEDTMGSNSAWRHQRQRVTGLREIGPFIRSLLKASSPA